MKAGVKCIRKGGALDPDGNWGSAGSDYEDVVRLGSLSVANAVFHSQAAAAAADHEHVNTTVQYWLQLMHAPSPPPPSPRTPPLSNFLLFALQNLAAHSPAAVLISSTIRPSHLLPLFSPLALSDYAIDAASFAAGSHQPSHAFSSHPTRLSQVSSAICCVPSPASAPNTLPPPFRRQQHPTPHNHCSLSHSAFFFSPSNSRRLCGDWLPLPLLLLPEAVIRLRNWRKPY